METENTGNILLVTPELVHREPLLLPSTTPRFGTLSHHSQCKLIEEWNGERCLTVGRTIDHPFFYQAVTNWTELAYVDFQYVCHVARAMVAKDMKTMMIYIRTAGIDIRGITDRLNLHDPHQVMAKVLGFPGVLDAN